MTTPPIMTINDELLAELEAAANAATPGPYRQCGADTESKSCACGQIWSTATDELVAFAHNGDAIIDSPAAGQSANSQFMAAANPATILALLAERAGRMRQIDTLTGWYANALNVIAECSAVLPCSYYMDQPDGGDVPVPEQLRRMAKDAERYRWLRGQMVGASFDWDDEGMTVLAFEIPEGVSLGADCDKNVDAARSSADKGADQ